MSFEGPTFGLTRSRRKTRQMLKQELQEIHAVAVAHQVTLPNEAIAETLAFIDTLGRRSGVTCPGAQRPSQHKISYYVQRRDLVHENDALRFFPSHPITHPIIAMPRAKLLNVR